MSVNSSVPPTSAIQAWMSTREPQRIEQLPQGLDRSGAGARSAREQPQ
jgi:hypothetical protein